MPEFVVDPPSPRDITVHMSLPVKDDLEDLLEEGNKLQRWGYFNEALQVFQELHERSPRNRYILVQYGECLLEAGQFSCLASLARNKKSLSSVDILEVSWDLLLLRAEIDIPGKERATLSNVSKAARDLLKPSWPHLSSTEVRILVLALGHPASAITDAFNEVGSWHRLYRHLLFEGMIWELRDILEELIARDGVERTLGRLWGERDQTEQVDKEDGLDRLRQDWGADFEFDDSTSVALLDIFTTMAYDFMLDQPPNRNIQRCLRIAREHAARLVAGSNKFMKSRPYLKWVMVKLISQDYERVRYTNIVFRGILRGSLSRQTNRLPGNSLPVYAPVDDEAPEWKPQIHQPSEEAIHAVTMVKQAALDVGDLQMQAACLQELIWLHVEGPEVALEELHKLWSDASHWLDIRCLHLFRYMSARTPAARQQLRGDILAAGEFPHDGFSQYARYMILRALATHTHEKELYLERAEELARRDTSQKIYRERDSEGEHTHDGDRWHRSNNQPDDGALNTGIMRPPWAGSPASRHQLSVRLSVGEEEYQRARRTKEPIIISAPRREISQYSRLKHFKERMNDVGNLVDSLRHDDKPRLVRLKNMLHGLSAECMMLISGLEDGASGPQPPEPLPNGGDASNDNEKQKDGRFARVGDCEYSSDHIVAFATGSPRMYHDSEASIE